MNSLGNFYVYASLIVLRHVLLKGEVYSSTFLFVIIHREPAAFKWVRLLSVHILLAIEYLYIINLS